MADITLQNTPATLGDIANWNVGETTNPPTIGLPNPGTGGVNGSAAYGSESEFAIEKDATFRATPFPDSELVGSIESVTVNGSAGLDVSVDWSMSSYFGGLSVDRIAPPVLNQPLGAILQSYIGLVYDAPVAVSSTRIPLPGFDSTLYSFPGWSGNVWAHICDLLAKLDAEIVYWPDASGQPALEVRPMSSVTLDLDDKEPPTFRYESGSPGHRIDVVRQNQSVILSAYPNITNYSTNPSLESDASGWAATTPTGLPQPPGYGTYLDITWGAGLFVAVGGDQVSYDSCIATSVDGVTWSAGVMPAGIYRGIVWSGSLFVAVGILSTSPTVGCVATSPDGVNWTARTIPDGGYRAIAWSGSRFVAVGSSGICATSTDGITWSGSPSTGRTYLDIQWGIDKFVAVGTGVVATSDDGVIWTERIVPPLQPYNSVAWGNGVFVVVGGSAIYPDGIVLTSADGVSWAPSVAPPARYYSVGWVGEGFVASGFADEGGMISTSPDGLTWTLRKSGAPSGGNYNAGIAANDDLILASGSIGNVSPSVVILSTSRDGGATWEDGLSSAYVSNSRESDSLRAFAGDYSYRIRVNVPSGGVLGAPTATVTSRFDLPTVDVESLAGGVVTIGAWTMLYNPTPTIYQSTGTARLLVSFLDADGNEVQSHTGGAISLSGFSTWSGLVPATAKNAKCSIRWEYVVLSSAGATNRTDVRLHADAHFVADGFGVPYFDGNSPNSAWNGTSNNSSSTQVNPNNIPLYDAYADNNNIMSVESGEVARFIITSGVYPTSILRPVPVDTLPINVGNYHVIDSTGLPIIAQQWVDYGGEVSVAVGDGVGEIVVTITAPDSDIPSTTGPYRLAASDGDNEYATLMVAGTGIITKPQTLNLLTGADRDRVTQELAATINSPFVNTLDDAYTVGTWLSAYSNGHYPVIDFTIPTSTLGGVGLGPGSTFVARDCKYRVSSVNWDNLSCRGTAIRYSTIADYEAAIGTRTIGDHDALWGAYTIRDFEIKSHKTV